MLVLEVYKKTLFIKVDWVYPECKFLIGKEPKLYPFLCLKDHCPRNMNCMDKLAHRVKYIFDSFPEAKLLILYFTHHDSTSRRAGVFWRDMREPRFITMNRSYWEKLKKIGIVYEWELPDSLFLK